MHLVIGPGGAIRGLYSETLPWTALGSVSIRRGSFVEPTPAGDWRADLAPVGGPLLGPFGLRSEALAAEVAWLEQHWLTRPG